MSNLELMIGRLVNYKPNIQIWPWRGEMWCQLTIDGGQIYNGPLSGLYHAIRNWLRARAEDEVTALDQEDAVFEQALKIISGKGALPGG